MSFHRSSILWVWALVALGPGVAHAQGTIPDSTHTLPWVQRVLITPLPDALPVERPICPGDSILVRVIGAFPTPCHDVVGVQLLPSPIAAPFPVPPIVRVQVRRSDCDGGCAQVITPFEARAVLPPLPVLDYFLLVEVEDLGCTFTDPSTVYRDDFPFRVYDCTSPGACLIGGWHHPGPTLCDAHIGPGGTAEVTFTVYSQVALAGLQGTFHVFGTFPNERVATPPLEITRLEAVGPAAGMRLGWNRTADGARFVLFAEGGAPIPPTAPSTLPPGVLKLTLAPLREPLPDRMYVYASDLLGADADGQGVPECNIRTFAAVQAVICNDVSNCDFNRDGRLDIRDLVLMVRCLTVPEDTRDVSCGVQFHDCTDDGIKDLADVICCAREMLRAGCIDCAPSPGDGPVGASLTAPRFEGDEVTLSLALEGWASFAGALVRVAYPDDRYELSYDTFEVPGMLGLSETRDGEVAFGFIRMPGAEAPQPYDRGDVALLRLRLKPGMAHGGAVAFSGGEFSGPDGEPLEASFEGGAALGGPARVGLSQARPNPFTGATAVELTLDRPAVVALRVFDLAGRQVATLHDGRLEAGTASFVWDGATDDGRPTRSGIYFLRVTSGGEEAVRKVIRLD